MTFSPAIPSSSERRANMPIRESGVEARIHEISQMLSFERKKREEEDQPQDKTRTDGFEPFVNPESTDNHLFNNYYDGAFAQKMVLNRIGIERVLKIAHLGGKVFLVRFDPSRRYSFVKDERRNPLYKVMPAPEGWRIGINDTRMMQELQEKKLPSGKLQEEFIKQFNRQLKLGVLECVRREKLSSEKDRHFKFKAIFSILPIPLQTLTRVPSFIERPFLNTLIGIVYMLVGYAVANLMGPLITKSKFRKVDSLWEYFMPLVEIDKVVRSWAFLAIRGKTLVKETKQPDTK